MRIGTSSSRSTMRRRSTTPSSQRKAPHRLPGHERGHRAVGARRACHRPRLALLDHARGRGQGRPGPSDAVRACDAPARRGDDSRLLAGSTWAVRAHVRHPSDRLPKELAAHDITTMAEARYLAEHYRSAFNEEFARRPNPAVRSCPSALDWPTPVRAPRAHRGARQLRELRAQARFRLRPTAITSSRRGCGCTAPDERLAVFHGPRKLAEYECDGSLVVHPRRRARAAHPQRCGAVRVLWNCGRPLRGPARALRAVWTARGQRWRVPPPAHTLAPHNPTGPTTDREQPDNPCATKPDSSICCHRLQEQASRQAPNPHGRADRPAA